MFYLTNERYKEMTQRAYGKKDDEVSPLSYMNSDEISTYTTPQQKEQQGVLADTADAFQMGMGRGASDLSRLVAIGANKLGWNNVESWFNKAADMAAEYADEQVTQMSDEMREALNQDVTEDPSALTNIRWWAGNLGSVLGSELDTVIVSAVTLGAGSAAYAGAKTAAKQGAKYVLKKELAEKVGQVAFKEAVKRGASNKFAQIAALDAVQSAMMAGSRANQTREDMLRLSDEELANNDKFIQEYSAISNSEDGQLMTGNERFEAAKNNFIAKASRDAAFDPKAMLSDLATNAISGLGGGFMGLGKAAKTKTGGFLKGAFKESATEAIQGATEQYAINETAKEYYDPDRDLMENVASNAVQSAILGAGFGGPTGVLDVYSERRAFNKAKKQLLNFKSTGNETVDQSLRSYVDMVNQQANDLDDLITQSRFNAHYAMAQREARAANIMADLNQSTNQPDLSQSPTQDAVNTFTQNHKPIQTSAITENQLGGTDEIDIGNGNYQPISYAVVDVANLTPTQNKADNQFRDRNRVASLSQINEIARNLDPRKLSASPTMDIGAPLLAQDGATIIAGNGRAMALQQAYQQGLANNYRQYLLDNADKFGLSPEQISQVANPVLVRRLNVPVDIAQTAINSNEQGGMRMSNLEQAKVDSQRLPNLDAFYISENGDLNTSENQGFIRQFIANQPQNLRNELLDGKGNLSQAGIQRVRNAILYRAYGDTETLSRAVESTDPGAKNIITALTRIAPTVAQAKQDVESGRLKKEVDLSSDIVAAVEKYNQLKQQDLSVDEYLKQQDFVSDVTPEAKEILQIFNENTRSSKRIADILNNYYQAAQKQGNTAQTNMFDEVIFDRESALVQAKNIQDSLFDESRFSLREDDNSDFAKAVDAVANGEDPLSPIITLGTTPDVLKMLGIDNAKVVMPVRVLRKDMIGKHAVSAEAMKQLPKQMNNPIAVMQSRESSTNPEAYLVLTELKEIEKNKELPVIAALKFTQNESGELELIEVASAYGRKNIKVAKDLDSRVLYWNKEKGNHFFDNFSLSVESNFDLSTLRTSLSNNDYLFSKNIRTEEDLRQYQSKYSDIRYSRKSKQRNEPYNKDLIVTHNISAESIIHAQKIGGLPYASVAITRQQNPLTGFGEVTLIGDSNYIDPKGENKAKVFGADIYSPRYPSVTYEYKSEDIKKLQKRFQQSADEIQDSGFSYNFSQGLNQTGIKKAMLDSDAVKYQFLKEKEIAHDFAYRTIEKSRYADFDSVQKAIKLGITANYLRLPDAATQYESLLREFIKEKIHTFSGKNDPFVNRIKLRAERALNGDKYDVLNYVRADMMEAINNQQPRQEIDYIKTKENIRNAIKQHKEEFYHYIDEIVEGIKGKEKIFKGENRYGGKIYMDHTLENVVKKLKKDLVGGEQFNYGLPVIRAKVTPKFKSIQDIQNNKHRLVSQDDFAKIKAEIEQEKIKLAKDLGVNNWDIDNLLFDVVDAGVSTAFNSANVENNADNRQYVAEFLEKLKAMPTEYFEGKAKEVTQFSDFKGAVIPSDLPVNARKVLQDAGLAIYEHDPNEINSRVNAIKLATNDLDVKTNGQILFSKKQKVTLSTSYNTKQLQTLLSNILKPDQLSNVDIVTGQTAPENVRRFIRDGVEGWFNPKTGKVTLVPSNIRATKNMSREMRLAWVAWHELGHLGVNVKYRADYKGIMEKARKHSVVGAMSEAIMADRKRFVDKSGKYTDPAATNKDIATEEALVELLAAHETGNFDELRQRYGVKINTLHEKNFKAWFKIIADKVRQLMNKLFGRSFDEMTDYDLIRLIGGIKQGINSNPTPPTTGKRFSLNERSDSDFARAVDDVASGKFTAKQVIDVGTTPAVLKMLGLPDVNVVINGSVLKKVMLDKHNVRPEVLKQLPRQINNPVAVMKSSTQQNGYVVLTELTENVNGVDKPIIAALHLKQSKQGLELINIASVYGRNISQLQNGLNNDLLYWNKTKGSQLARTVGLQLPSSLTSAENLSVGSVDNLTLQLRSPLSKNQPLSNIKTEEDLKQYLPEIKFSAATSVLDSAFNKLGYGEKESALERGVSEFKQAKSRTVSEWKALATDWGRKMNTWVFDSLAPIKYWEDKAGVTDHSLSGYTAARLAAGSGSIAEASMTHGLPEWKDGIIQRKAGTSKNDALLGIMENLGDDMNNFLAWIAGNRAEKLMAEGREHNLSVEEIQELKALNKGKEQKFEQARKKLMAWNKSLLDLAEQAGLFTKEDRAKWEDPDWYIPFYRETDDGDVLAPFKNKGLANQNAGIKRLKGSDKATADLLSNIITNATKLIDASVKNDALTKAVVNLADTDVITVIDKPNQMDYQRLERNKQGKDIQDGGLAKVKIKGQDYLIDIHDKALFNAITSVDQKPLDYTGRKIFAGAKRILTATVTSMPDFIVRNFLRDLVQAATTDRNHMRLGIDSLKGLKEAYSKGGVSVDLMFSGASFGHGYLDAGDPKQAAENIRKHLRKKGYSKSEIDGYMKTIVWSKDQFTNLLDKYQHLNSAVENANRIAVYEAALRNGKSKAQAALEAKDLMDFSMKGNARIIRYAADVLPFFNARLQGLSQLGRSFKDNPKTFAKRGAMIALTSVGLALANMGNDRYEKLPDEEKDNYWHIFLGDQHLRIPKPFELGVVFGTIPERLLRTTLGEDSTGKLSDRISAAVINTLSLNPMPQVIKPIFELYMNKDMFTGREIESLSDKRFIASARYDYNTSLTARELGQITGNFGISPKQIDHLARGYFGTLGMYVLGMSDYLLRQTGDYGAQPDKNMNEYPVFSALWGGNINVPRRYTSYMNDYYEYLNKVTEIVATINNYEKKRGMKQEAERLREENQGLLRNAPLLNKTQKEIKGIKGELDLIYQDRVMSAEQKRARIDRLLEKRNNLIKMVAERIQKEDYL